MAEKKQSKDPFDIFSESSTRFIKLKSLNNAEVEIKNALTVSEEHDVILTTYSNQMVEGITVLPNQADLYRSKIQIASMLLVSPKKSMTELGELNGGRAVIEELYENYMKFKKDTRGN